MDYEELINLKSIIIKGDYKTKRICINGRELTPELSLNIYAHSPGGFDWGDSGNGSAQLALAILYDLSADKRLSMILHHLFKNDFISDLKKSDFEIKINIADWFFKRVGRNSQFCD